MFLINSSNRRSRIVFHADVTAASMSLTHHQSRPNSSSMLHNAPISLKSSGFAGHASTSFNCLCELGCPTSTVIFPWKRLRVLRSRVPKEITSCFSTLANDAGQPERSRIEGVPVTFPLRNIHTQVIDVVDLQILGCLPWLLPEVMS